MKIRIIVVLCLSFLLTLAAAAGEYDGYIFKTTEPIPLLFSDDGSITPAAFAENLYTADSEEEIYSFIDPSLIEYVEPNYIVELYDASTDPYYNNQWYIPTLGVEEVWQKFDNLAPVTVAVIDSGLIGAHEDLDYENRVIAGYNTIKNTTNTVDTYFHGTLVASVIAATRDNGKGIAGLSDNAIIVPIKAFDAKSGSLDNIVDAIYLAVNTYDADVINMSFGMTSNAQSLKDAVEYAYSKGVIMCAAAGNSGNAQIDYPAGYDCVIGVGATDQNDEICTFSQYNATVTVAAPGKGICGFSITVSPNGDYYQKGDGTSFAAPVVSSLAAIAKGINPALTPDEFIKLLTLTSVDLGEAGRDDYYGHGRIDFAALTHRLTNPIVTFPEYVTVSTPAKTLKSGDSVPVGTALTVKCNLPVYLEPTIYVGNSTVTDSVKAGYGDVEISVKHKGLSVAVLEADAEVTAIVANYSDDGRTETISVATLTADSDGNLDIPTAMFPAGEGCKLFIFSDFATLSLVSLTEFA